MKLHMELVLDMEEQARPLVCSTGARSSKRAPSLPPRPCYSAGPPSKTSTWLDSSTGTCSCCTRASRRGREGAARTAASMLTRVVASLNPHAPGSNCSSKRVSELTSLCAPSRGRLMPRAKLTRPRSTSRHAAATRRTELRGRKGTR